MSALTRFPARRATGWFWALTAIAILLVGALSRALTATPSPSTGLTVAGVGILLVAVFAQAARLLLALVRASGTTAQAGQRHAGQDPDPDRPATRADPPTAR